MYAFAQNWRNKDVPVISGFHTPMESECLRILLRGAQPITSLSRKLGSRQILPEIVKGFRFPLFLIEHYDNSSVDKLPLSVDK